MLGKQHFCHLLEEPHLAEVAEKYGNSPAQVRWTRHKSGSGVLLCRLRQPQQRLPHWYVHCAPGGPVVRMKVLATCRSAVINVARALHRCAGVAGHVTSLAVQLWQAYQTLMLAAL
jgi:hypothetical protein